MPAWPCVVRVLFSWPAKFKPCRSTEHVKSVVIIYMQIDHLLPVLILIQFVIVSGNRNTQPSATGSMCCLHGARLFNLSLFFGQLLHAAFLMRRRLVQLYAVYLRYLQLATNMFKVQLSYEYNGSSC